MTQQTLGIYGLNLSHVMRKHVFFPYANNKGADHGSNTKLAQAHGKWYKMYVQNCYLNNDIKKPL